MAKELKGGGVRGSKPGFARQFRSQEGADTAGLTPDRVAELREKAIERMRSPEFLEKQVRLLQRAR